jgi:hypothetical protein
MVVTLWCLRGGLWLVGGRFLRVKSTPRLGSLFWGEWGQQVCAGGQIEEQATARVYWGKVRAVWEVGGFALLRMTARANSNKDKQQQEQPQIPLRG